MSEKEIDVPIGSAADTELIKVVLAQRGSPHQEPYLNEIMDAVAEEAKAQKVSLRFNGVQSERLLSGLGELACLDVSSLELAEKGHAAAQMLANSLVENAERIEFWNE